MNKKLKTGIGIGIFAVVAIVAVLVFFRHKPMIKPADNPRVVSIGVIVGQDGETYDYNIPESGISDELNDALISLFLNTEMRNRLLPRPQSYDIANGSVFITVKVLLEHSSMRVNLSNGPDYSSAQFDTHYHIVDHQELYQNVYGLLSDVMTDYAVKRQRAVFPLLQLVSLQNRPKPIGQGSLHRQALPGGWMGKRELGRVEALSRQAGHRLFRAVHHISQQGVAQIGHMHPDLMRPARFQAAGDV